MQGVIALFDSDDKLVLCNSRYGEIVARVVPGLLRPGIPFERIVREGAGKGLYGETEGDFERVIAKRLEDQRNLPSVRHQRNTYCPRLDITGYCPRNNH